MKILRVSSCGSVHIGKSPCLLCTIRALVKKVKDATIGRKDRAMSARKPGSMPESAKPWECFVIMALVMAVVYIHLFIELVKTGKWDGKATLKLQRKN